jgi:hypothetical protein
MKEETGERSDVARAGGETSGADTAQAESAGLQAERESAAAMNADVPQPPDESQKKQ